MSFFDNLPLVSGLVGTIIGAAASIAGQIIQSHHQSKRDRIKLIVETAIADHRLSFDMLKSTNRPFSMTPLPVYIHYHNGLLNLLERGEVTPDTLRNLRKQSTEVIAMIDALDKEKEN